jgi:hypothetical protein
MTPNLIWLLTGLAIRKGAGHGAPSARQFEACLFLSDRDTPATLGASIDNGQPVQLAGAAIDVHFHQFWDTKRPLNVSDSGLSPSMREILAEHARIPEILFCSIRLEVGDCMRQLKSIEKSGHKSGGQPSSTAEQDRVIGELESRLEQGFSRKCDPYFPFTSSRYTWGGQQSVR